MSNPVVLDLTIQPIKTSYAFWKRVLDVIGAIGLMIVLFPVFLVIAIAVKLTSRGPAFYRSERVGIGGRIFKFYKFRSMYVDADKRVEELLDKNEKDGPIFKMKNDPRVTPIGRFLRRFSLDELPQLLNVLMGDMSLVGPRPPLPREVQCYDAHAAKRLTVKPGLTCY